jgi:PPOX class probable F420-dependent enzyme
MELTAVEARARFAAARVARLATVRPDGGPHLVPITFAVVGDVIHSSVDDKPKRSRALTRLANLRSEARCSVLVDHYDEDWSQLWWVRADGVARIVDPVPADDPGLSALAERYDAYRRRPPPGPAIRIDVVRWTGWAAA